MTDEKAIEFLSTPSARRATSITAATVASWEFLSTPSARRATQTSKPESMSCKISIHALREEGDGGRRRFSHFPFYFYPRPPRGGRPASIRTMATGADFYPRPPRGGRRFQPAALNQLTEISIHALREEGDCLQCVRQSVQFRFLSTPSARRATAARYGCCAASRNFYPRPPRGGRHCTGFNGRCATYISIHALREEGDMPALPVAG